MSRIAIALSIFCLMLVPVRTASVAKQTATFSTRVEVVRVDVLVTDDGRPVDGLRAEDFEVQDNGVDQRVTIISAEKMPLNVTLALDISESVVGNRLRSLQAAGNSILDGITSRDRASLLTFNQSLSLPSSPTADVAAVRAAIGAIQPGGQTHLFDATYAAMMLGEADGLRGLVIVFTDGNDTGSFLASEAVVDIVRRSDAVIYSVAIPSGARSALGFLRDISRHTGGTLFELQSPQELSVVFARILDEFRHRYLLSYSPSGVGKAGWHTIDVRVKGHGRVSIKARAGYYR